MFLWAESVAGKGSCAASPAPRCQLQDSSAVCCLGSHSTATDRAVPAPCCPSSITLERRRRPCQLCKRKRKQPPPPPPRCAGVRALASLAAAMSKIVQPMPPLLSAEHKDILVCWQSSFPAHHLSQAVCWCVKPRWPSWPRSDADISRGPLWTSCCTAWLSSWRRSVSLSPAWTSLASAYAVVALLPTRHCQSAVRCPEAIFASGWTSTSSQNSASDLPNQWPPEHPLLCCCLSSLEPQKGHNAWKRPDGPWAKGITPLLCKNPSHLPCRTYQLRKTRQEWSQQKQGHREHDLPQFSLLSWDQKTI